VLRAKHVVVAAGPLGTNQLLANCRHSGSLPALSRCLGESFRTNSESITAITARDRGADFSPGVALTGSVWPNADTHIEVGTWGAASDATALFFVPLTADGSRLTRPLKLAAAVARAPRDAITSSDPRGWSRRTMIMGAMQTRDVAMRLRPRRRLLGTGVRLQTEQDPERPNPTFIPELHEFTSRMAGEVNGIAQSWITEALFNIPVTAHVLGGAVIASTPDRGVINPRHEVFGYRNLLVCDGAALPANPGVNPSLSIAAVTERAMSFVPPRGQENR
jgi:cholesterol oxidase